VKLLMTINGSQTLGAARGVDDRPCERVADAGAEPVHRPDRAADFRA
jgi:hypothetical protein